MNSLLPYGILHAMTSPFESARALLHDLELRLRELIAEATASRQYEQVSQIAMLTNQVGALVSSSGVASDTDRAAKGRTADAMADTSPERLRSSAKKVPSRAADYPHFYRQGDALVKVGWARSTKSEYSHRVSKAGIDALVAYLSSRRSHQSPISVDTMVNALKSGGRASILGYQVYVAVAWLKAEGWLVANGRHGYTLKRVKGIQPAKVVEDLWVNLPTDPAG